MIVSALLQPCYNLLHATCCTVYGGLKDWILLPFITACMVMLIQVFSYDPIAYLHVSVYMRSFTLDEKNRL